MKSAQTERGGQLQDRLERLTKKPTYAIIANCKEGLFT